MRHLPRGCYPRLFVAILASLLFVTLLINPVSSGSQPEFSIQSIGNIRYQDVFTDTIFFECGAESGALKPFWDDVGPHGSGDNSGSYTIVDGTHTRTGNYAMKLYQVPPPKSDAQRRISNRYYQTISKEVYISWWAYFDSRWNIQDLDGWGTTLGGWQLWFGPSWETYYWWTGGRFHITKDSRNIQFCYSWGKIVDGVNFSRDAEAIEQIWHVGDSIQEYLNQWVHFQVYVKIHETSGIVRAWFNNELIAEKMGIATDPRSYGEWYSNPVDGAECVFRSQTGGQYPHVGIELYQDESSFESWIWVDDVVVATEKIPESYAVVDK